MSDLIKQSYSLERSNILWEKAKKLIPAGTQTFSKGPSQFVQGVAPIFIQRAQGAHVFDVDGHEFIDYAMALGPITLGYNYPATNKAIQDQLKEGIVFSLMHPKEVELAEALVKIIPCAEMVRFGKNGSDATAAAIRVARAYTKRDKIACCGYHGWHDWYVGTTSRSSGVPEATKKLTLTFSYNNIDSLKKLFDQNKNEIAGVIMEPMSTIEPAKGFLQQVKDLVHQEGALLIFDEIVTGFRISLGGAQEHFNVTPDLACFGKGMANGMPIAALVGKTQYMRILEEAFVSFTFGGETLSLAAALSTIDEMQTKDVIAHLWKQGGRLQQGYRALLQRHGLEKFSPCIGLPPRSLIGFIDEAGKPSLVMKSLFQQEAIKRGVLFTGAHNICFSHTDEDIEETLRVYDEALAVLKAGLEHHDIMDRLEGDVVQPVFRAI